MPDTEADLRARVVGLEQATQTNNQRLATLETWQRQREIESARNDERWVAMESRIDARFSGLEGANKNIQSTLSRINWMIIGGIVVALVGFVFGEVKAAIKGLPQSRKPLLCSVNLRGNIYFQPK